MDKIVSLLDERHGGNLYKFLVDHKNVGGLLLLKQRDIFLSSRGAAIACLDSKELKQVLLCEIKEGSCFTRGLIGEFGTHTLEVLDTLCAICSSASPMITEHRMVILPTQIESFKALWPTTRLGSMAYEESWIGMVFRAKIKYPL